MQISLFNGGHGGFVAHKYRVPGLASRFSVWFNRDGFAIDAQRIDARGRAYSVPRDGATWRYIERHKIAGLDCARSILNAGGAA